MRWPHRRVVSAYWATGHASDSGFDSPSESWGPCGHCMSALSPSFHTFLSAKLAILLLFKKWSCGLVVECPPCTRETGVQFPVESDQRLLKVVPDASLLGTQHEGLYWGKFPCDVLASCPGGLRVLSYIKSPHAKETGDRPLPYGPAWLEKPHSLND